MPARQLGVGSTSASAAALLSLLALTACGGSPSGSGQTPPNRGNLVVAGTSFTENTILAYVYGKALEADGWHVQYKTNLGNREVVEPALEKGDVDLMADYAATELEFLNKGAGEASADITSTLSKLRQRASAVGLTALDASPAVDQSAFVVTKATAQKYNLKKLSDLGPVSGSLILGAGPACPNRPLCLPGLQRVYGVHFKDYKSLDVVGPLTKAALDRGDIDVAVLTTTDASIAEKGWVVLEDDKHLEPADNVFPLVRSKVITADLTKKLDAVSAALTTQALSEMNKSVVVDKDDPDAVADKWLKDRHLKR